MVNARRMSALEEGAHEDHPPEPYLSLLGELARIDKHMDEGGDKLQSAAAAVLAVNQFLLQDGLVQRTGIGKALRMLSDQLGDAYAGSKKTIFIKPIARGHRPSKASDAHRGMLVFALDTLIKTGIKNSEAATFLKNLLKNKGIKYDGKVISSALLLTWREQVGDTSPAAASAMMKQLADHQPVTIETKEDAKTVAMALVDVLARRNSN